MAFNSAQFGSMSDYVNSTLPVNSASSVINSSGQSTISSNSVSNTAGVNDFWTMGQDMNSKMDLLMRDINTVAQQIQSNRESMEEQYGSAMELLDQYNKTGEIAFLEAYIQNKLAIENENSSRAWQEHMSNTAFSRLVADIQRAGYNPWLALQNGYGQASTGSSSAAGVSGVSGSGQMTTKRGQDVSRENNKSNNATKFATTFISAMVKIFTSFMQAGATITSSVLGN